MIVGAYLSLVQNDYSAAASTSSMDILAKAVTQEKPSDYSSYRSWMRNLTWNTRPTVSDVILDYATTVPQSGHVYVSWDVTRMAAEWYEEHRTTGALELSYYNPNSKKATTGFIGYGVQNPVYFTVAYRNNVGIEPYYTYQTMGAGNAGTAYISDYSGQLTVAKSLVSLSLIHISEPTRP